MGSAAVTRSRRHGTARTTRARAAAAAPRLRSTAGAHAESHGKPRPFLAFYYARQPGPARGRGDGRACVAGVLYHGQIRRNVLACRL